MELKPLKVSELNQYIKRLITSDPLLYNISVEGEISNFKYHLSGHIYFTLKDEKGKIKCVFFKNENRQTDLILEDGMQVKITGYVSTYEKEGTYQFYVKSIKQKGIGELFEKYEALKRKLENEGLFEDTNKKRLVFLPRKIGVVTSVTGAAIRDIISVIKRRLPTVDIIIYPVLVQGEKAHVDICRAIKYLNTRDDIDTIIIGRGGGSLEELWPFNEEDVARAIFESEKTIISAVGHETDYTIADFVADLRAPTPSVAGELCVPQMEDLNIQLMQCYNRLSRAYLSYLSNKKNEISLIRDKISFYSPVNKLNDNKQRLDTLFKNLHKEYDKTYESQADRLKVLGEKLDMLSPLSILKRGYSITTLKNGQIVKSKEQVSVDTELNITLSDGVINVKVTS